MNLKLLGTPGKSVISTVATISLVSGLQYSKLVKSEPSVLFKLTDDKKSQFVLPEPPVCETVMFPACPE